MVVIKLTIFKFRRKISLNYLAGIVAGQVMIATDYNRDFCTVYSGPKRLESSKNLIIGITSLQFAMTYCYHIGHPINIGMNLS